MLGLGKKMNLQERLKHLAAEINRKEEFKVGDLVVWKDGMRNKKLEYGEMRVVTQIGVSAQDTEHNSGTPYYREPLDIVLGGFDSDGDFVEHYYDSRRLTLAK